MKNFDLRKFLAENRTQPTNFNEMASSGKLTGHEDYQFAMKQLEMLIKDKAVLGNVKQIVDMVGELGLDLGYAERTGDDGMK